VGHGDGSGSDRPARRGFGLHPVLHLINLAEEDYRVQALRQREREHYPAPTGESIAEAVGLIKQRGLPSDQLASFVRESPH